MCLDKECAQASLCADWQIPDDHLSGCVIYPHPDQPDLKVIKPEGAGLPDTDVLLYVKAQSTDKCRADVSSGRVLYWCSFPCLIIRLYFKRIERKCKECVNKSVLLFTIA